MCVQVSKGEGPPSGPHSLGWLAGRPPATQSPARGPLPSSAHCRERVQSRPVHAEWKSRAALQLLLRGRRRLCPQNQNGKDQGSRALWDPNSGSAWLFLAAYQRQKVKPSGVITDLRSPLVGVGRD